MKINQCPQCQKNLRKTKNKKFENVYYYKCSDCKYTFNVKDNKNFSIFFDDGEVDKPRIVSRIAKCSVVVDKYNAQNIIYEFVDEINKGEIYAQFFYYNPSYWGGAKRSYKNLSDEPTIEEFYKNFIDWFNA